MLNNKAKTQLKSSLFNRHSSEQKKQIWTNSEMRRNILICSLRSKDFLSIIRRQDSRVSERIFFSKIHEFAKIYVRSFRCAEDERFRWTVANLLPKCRKVNQWGKILLWFVEEEEELTNADWKEVPVVVSMLNWGKSSRQILFDDFTRLTSVVGKDFWRRDFLRRQWRSTSINYLQFSYQILWNNFSKERKHQRATFHWKGVKNKEEFWTQRVRRKKFDEKFSDVYKEKRKKICSNGDFRSNKFVSMKTNVFHLFLLFEHWQKTFWSESTGEEKFFSHLIDYYNEFDLFSFRFLLQQNDKNKISTLISLGDESLNVDIWREIFVISSAFSSIV